jgi:hypothetical protein
VADRKELHELHVDELGAGTQRQRVAVTAHVGGCAVAAIKSGQPAGCNDHGLGGERDGASGRQMQGRRAAGFAVTNRDIDDHKLTDAADRVRSVQLRAQRARYRRPGGKKIDIGAAGSIVARRLRLLDMTVLARPADLPAIHLAQSQRPVLAQQCGEALVAKTASGGERIGQVMLPMIRRLLAQRCGDRHLRHDRGAAAPNQAAVRQNHRRTGPRGFKSRVHAGAAGTDHQDVGLDMRWRRRGTVASSSSHVRSRFTSLAPAFFDNARTGRRKANLVIPAPVRRRRVLMRRWHVLMRRWRIKQPPCQLKPSLTRANPPGRPTARRRSAMPNREMDFLRLK